MSIPAMNYVFEKSPARGSARLVLLVLADRASDAGVCWPGVADVARRANMSRRQAERHIKGLLRCGQVELVQPGRGPGRSNHYRLCICERTTENPSPATGLGQKPVTGHQETRREGRENPAPLTDKPPMNPTNPSPPAPQATPADRTGGGARTAGQQESPTPDLRSPQERAAVEKLLAGAGVVKRRELAALPHVTEPLVRRILADAERENWRPGLIYTKLVSDEPMDAAEPAVTERSPYANGDSPATVARDRAKRRADEAKSAAELTEADVIVAAIPPEELRRAVEGYRQSLPALARPENVPADWQDKLEWVRGVADIWRKHRGGQGPRAAGPATGRKPGAVERSLPRTGLGTGPHASGPGNPVPDAP